MNQLCIKNMNQIKKKKKKGFTLVELIVVIAIIAILAAMSIPRLGAMRVNARVSNDVAAAKNIATIVSTLVANGEIGATTINVLDTDDSSTTDVEGAAATAIRANLDGAAADGNAEALANAHFTVTVDADDNITVSVTTGAEGAESYQLYPDDEDSDKTAYATAARQ